MNPYPVVSMKGITKIFPGVLANDRIDFDLNRGEIHALLGENGAGKTTLMNILYGVLQADEGTISIRGEEIRRHHSPRESIRMKLGMVHQHFALLPPLTVAENVILGSKSFERVFIDANRVVDRIKEISDAYEFAIDPLAIVEELSAGEQQRVEILKVLIRGADILILDEPTALLTPQGAAQLFRALRSMTDKGCTVIFISHKLDEVMEISDRITVLRDGRVVSTVRASETGPNELARMMVDREVVFRLEKPPKEPGDVVLKVEDLTALNDRKLPALDKISFAVRAGEILGVAGVSGNGQKELCEVIWGLRKAESGQIMADGKNITSHSTKKISAHGIGYVPADRIQRGSLSEFTVAENLVLGQHDCDPFCRSHFLNSPKIRRHAERLIDEFNIKPPNPDTRVKNLSGGNRQKMILAREIFKRPKCLLVEQPTRGLDVGATEYVRQRLLERRQEGTAIILISEDLEEIKNLSDRIAIMFRGKIVGIVPPETGVEEIGLLMAGSRGAGDRSKKQGGDENRRNRNLP
jgi:simple sugar transport system ATP-binding protein